MTVGNYIAISQVRDDVAAAYRKEIEWQATEKLLPYKKMCSQRKVCVVGFFSEDHPNFDHVILLLYAGASGNCTDRVR